MAESPWDVLGVPPGTDLPTVKKAWRTLAHLYHPDHHNGAPEAVRKEAARRLDAINTALRAIESGSAGARPEPPPSARRGPSAPPPPRPPSAPPRSSAPPPPPPPPPPPKQSTEPNRGSSPYRGWTPPVGATDNGGGHRRLAGSPSIWVPPQGAAPRTRVGSARYANAVNGDPNTVWVEAELTAAQDFVFAALRTAGCTFRADVVPLTFGVKLGRSGATEVVMQFKRETPTVTRCQFFGPTSEAGLTALTAVRDHVGKKAGQRRH